MNKGLQEGKTLAQVEQVDPERARKILTGAKLEGQRPIRQPWVAALAREIDKGTFWQATTIHLADVFGNRYLLDGQHRLSAVISSGQSQWFIIAVHPCKDMDEVKAAYYHIDQNRRRSPGDMYRIMNLQAEFGMVKTEIKALGSGVAYINNNFRSGGRTVFMPDDRLDMMRHFCEAAQQYFRVVALPDGIPKAMRRGAVYRQPVVALALATYQYSVEDYGTTSVDEFWNGMIQDDGLSKGDPRKTGNNHLMFASVARRSSKGLPLQATNNYTVRYLAHCWNAWAAGRQLRHTTVHMDRPIRILGTPWTGKAK